MKELIVLMGPPGSGKSTYARRFPVVVSTDALRENHGGWPKSTTDYSAFYKQLNVALRRSNRVVFDSMGTAQPRAHLLRIAAWQHATARLVVFDTPLEVCVARQSGRMHSVPEVAVAKWHGELVSQHPNVEMEGWDAVEWVRS